MGKRSLGYVYRNQVLEEDVGDELVDTEFEINATGVIYDRDGGRGMKKAGHFTKKGQLIVNPKYAKRFPLQVKRLVRILKELSEAAEA